MPPKLITDDGAHVVIRPLAYCAEADIARYARAVEYPIIPCNLCGSQENMQRKKIREMMRDWDRRYPAAPKRCSRRCRTWCPRIWPTTNCSISVGCNWAMPSRRAIRRSTARSSGGAQPARAVSGAAQDRLRPVGLCSPSALNCLSARVVLALASRA